MRNLHEKHEKYEIPENHKFYSTVPKSSQFWDTKIGLLNP